MKIEQLSIFLENKAGRLAEVTDVLAKACINIRALSLADTSDFGILRLIVNDHETAKTALKSAGFTVGLTSVVAVEVPHVPGGLNAILQMLGKKGINVEYMYAFLQKGDNAVLIFRFNNLDAAMEVLREAKIPILSSEQVCHG
ncbi:ACT domain protein [uncultured delta proteobacterium]|uniref:ACT domain protein n=1 Tax=uncultured delta proteobacterium TaxID=34034 RepID=A0A212J4Q5_9DELT|nr:ACT domain protein [uncultured delta proteobacterium]